MEKRMTLMSITVWLLFGGIAGWIVSIIAGTDVRHGILSSIAVGIIGALIGGFIVTSVGGRGINAGLDLYSLLVAVFGATALLLGYKALSRSL